ncbi:MAG: hypothetical protein JW908_03620 [Anaerolineales bacterium]|nr:hypothetical protein [Anaerolineales bacterium]
MKKPYSLLIVLLLTLITFTSAYGSFLSNALPAEGTPPANNWANYDLVPIPMWGGVDSDVYALAVDGSGNLYAGGAFSEYAGACFYPAGGTDCKYIAKWNGSSWSALETGMNNIVHSIAVDNSGNVYAAGTFTSAGSCTSGCNYIAKWNGSTWSALGSGMNDVVDSLAIDSSGNLYAGGEFTSAGSCTSGCNFIAKWDGSNWSSVGSGMTSGYGVYSLVFDSSGVLYAGGNFFGAGSCSALSGCEYMAKWDGSAWSVIGGRAGWIIYDLAVDSNNNLYAGGIFTSMPGCISGCNRVAKWDGSTWSALSTGMSVSGAIVYSVALDSTGNLYAGGNFSTAGTCSSGCVGIARWDGSTWTPLGNGLYDYDTGYASAARFLAYDGRGRMYVGGYFTRTDNKRVRYVSYWTAGEGQCGLVEGGDYTFYSGNMPVDIHINTLGTLDCLSMQRFNKNHPNAQSYQQTGYYWSLRGLDSSNNTATGFDIQMTLPYTSADANDALCRWMDDEWKCNTSSYVANTSVTVDHVTHFSDWAVGNNAPTAVILDNFNAAPESHYPWIILTLVGMGLFIAVILTKLRQLYL